ncbi:unnamed protein product [Oppiella nova]|uniref:Elongation of very long chain fatty acids protein n=1 Tax=Oppiella nova TaxID=334625 RepID=A0A7R9M339_9ACAR|nr:unnamed protein product [Oppiella nova]CAG2169902.1 unnamed protein product [Oppiella nova]
MFVLINTGIHTLKYGYYALAALGPRVRPYLRRKRYITVLQIAQFVICGTYGCLLYYKQTVIYRFHHKNRWTVGPNADNA